MSYTLQPNVQSKMITHLEKGAGKGRYIPRFQKGQRMVQNNHWATNLTAWLSLYLHTSTHKGVGLIPEKKSKVGAWLGCAAKKFQHIDASDHTVTGRSVPSGRHIKFLFSLPCLFSLLDFSLLISCCSILTECCPTKAKVHPTWAQGQSAEGQNLESGRLKCSVKRHPSIFLFLKKNWIVYS